MDYKIMEGSRCEKKWPTVFASNMLYLIILALMTVIPYIMTLMNIEMTDSINYHISMFILQIVLIAGPPLIYMAVRKMKIREVVRINSLRMGEVLLIIGMAIFGYGVITALNLAWYWVISHWGTPIGQELPQISTPAQYLMAIVTICLVPAVVEEFLFRGVVLRGYEKYGWQTAIVVTGILFGLLHRQLMALPATIILGIVISYVVFRTNSIFAGTIYHFIYNGISISIVYMQSLMEDFLDIGGGIPQDLSQVPQEILTMGYIVWGFIGLCSLGIFMVCFIFFHKYTQGRGRVHTAMEQERKLPGLVELLPGIISVLFVLFLLGMEVYAMRSGLIN